MGLDLSVESGRAGRVRKLKCWGGCRSALRPAVCNPCRSSFAESLVEYVSFVFQDRKLDMMCGALGQGLGPIGKLMYVSRKWRS